MSKLTVGFDAPRILDFDIESRPLGWFGGDFTHQEVTAVGSAWIVDGQAHDMEVVLLDKKAGSMERMLKAFRKRYEEADMVVGHYIRGFDLPQLNAAMLEFGFDPLEPIMTHDTKGDLIKFQGLSKSQENLGALLGLESPKITMNVPMWREANRLEQSGIELAKIRVAGDVIQNIELRQALLEAGFLAPPKVWEPASNKMSGRYAA